MLKVLGICGSPRAGNSKFLLEVALESAAQAGENLNIDVQTESWSIRGKKISGCVMCNGCAKNGRCIINDDFQEISEKWMEADVIIYSVPVYHMGMPAQLKAFIDRIGNSFFGRYVDKFPGNEAVLPKSLKTIGCISQGVHIFSGQEHTITQIINHSLIMGCIPVTGDMWQSYIGAGGWTCNVTDKDALKKQYANGERDAVIAVESSRTLAARAVEIEAIIKDGGRVFYKILSKDPIYSPFHSRIQVE